MRARKKGNSITVNAIGGTHVVLLGLILMRAIALGSSDLRSGEPKPKPAMYSG